MHFTQPLDHEVILYELVRVYGNNFYSHNHFCNASYTYFKLSCQGNWSVEMFNFKIGLFTLVSTNP